MLALGLPRGKAHEGVAPAKKWNRGKTQQRCCALWASPSTWEEIKDAVFFNYQKLSLLLVPADPQCVPAILEELNRRECDLKVNECSSSMSLIPENTLNGEGILSSQQLTQKP